MITKKRKIGNLGEEIALNFMKEKNFSLVEKNYSKLYGEIDLILKKRKELFFVEVKTGKIGSKILPEENLTIEKIKKFEKIVNYYLMEKKLKNIKHFFYLILVYLDQENKTAEVELLKEIY